MSKKNILEYTERFSHVFTEFCCLKISTFLKNKIIIIVEDAKVLTYDIHPFFCCLFLFPTKNTFITLCVCVCVCFSFGLFYMNWAHI